MKSERWTVGRDIPHGTGWSRFLVPAAQLGDEGGNRVADQSIANARRAVLVKLHR
jgi:hypothetical protein